MFTHMDYLPISQSFPVLSGGQMQWKSLMPSSQVEPSPHGEDAHSLIFIRQSGPVNPEVHSHMNQLIPSMQWPPL